MLAQRILKAPRKLGLLAAQWKRQEGGRETVGYLSQLGLDYVSAAAATKQIKKLASPIKAIRRRAFTANDGEISLPRVPLDKGFLQLSASAIAGTKELVDHCTAVFERKKEKVLANITPPYGFALTFKQTPQGIIMEDVEDFRPIVKFSSQPALFNLLVDYIGERPVLSDVSLIYTMPESGRVGPQLFHRDMNEPRQLHLVMPVWPVDMESGPFTFLPADRSAEVIKAINHTRGRIADETMFKYINETELRYCTGEPGTLYFVNPYACIHYGARTKSKPRLLLILNYTSLFQASEGTLGVYRCMNRAALDDGSDNTRMLLNL
jgi:hypothetical protein